MTAREAAIRDSDAELSADHGRLGTLEQALKYADTANLYTYRDDGIIRIIEVQHRG